MPDSIKKIFTMIFTNHIIEICLIMALILSLLYGIGHPDAWKIVRALCIISWIFLLGKRIYKIRTK